MLLIRSGVFPWWGSKGKRPEYIPHTNIPTGPELRPNSGGTFPFQRSNPRLEKLSVRLATTTAASPLLTPLPRPLLFTRSVSFFDAQVNRS
jgi:hypothetical protein